MAAKSLNVTYYSGSADGIIAITLKHTPIHMYIVPREELKEAKKIEGITKPGFYFLIDAGEDKQISRIYVGQTVQGIQRMFDHYAKKDWWTKTIMILGDSETFNLDLISGLEKYGMDKLSKSGYIVENGKDSQYILKSEVLSDVKWIFEETEFLLATQGYSLIKKGHKKSKPSAKAAPATEEKPAQEDKPAPETPVEEPVPQEPEQASAPELQPEGEANAQPAGTWISLDKDFNPTGYKIQAFSLSGKTHDTATFRSLLRDIMNLLYKDHSEIINGIADGGHKLSGRIRRDQNFTRPGQINGTDIGFESNWSAPDTIRFIRELADACGVNLKDIRICIHSNSETAEPLPAVEEPVPHYDASMEGILHISTKEAYGLGRYNPETGELTVLEGSHINLLKDNTKGPAQEAREKTLANGDISDEGGCSVLKKPYLFSTPSAAAMFVLGRSSNGWAEWKDASDVSLKDLYPKEQ